METKDILENIINQISQDISVTNIDQPESNVWDLTIPSPYWLMEGGEYVIDNYVYKLDSIDSGIYRFLPVDHTEPITATKFVLAGPSIFSGTYKMTKNEINAVRDKETILPMAWIREVIDDDSNTDPLSAIETATGVQIYFVGAAYYENWLTADHYDKVIYPLKSMVQSFVRIAKQDRLIAEEFDYTTTNLINLSVGGDQDESVFDLNLTGIEINISTEIRKDLTKGVCVPENEKFYLDALAKQFEVPSEGCITINVTDVTVNRTGKQVTFKSVESNDDFTATISQDKTSVEICTDRSTIELTGLNFTVTNGVVDAVGIIGVWVQATAAQGVVYNTDLLLNGTLRTLYNNDEAAQQLNGFLLQPNIPTNPKYYARIDQAASALSLGKDKLLGLNVFGNNNRYTDKNGEQVYPDWYMIDHLTGLGWWMEPLLCLDYADTYLELVEEIPGKAIGGYNDWRLPGLWAYNSIGSMSARDYMEQTPFQDAIRDYDYNEGAYQNVYLYSSTHVRANPEMWIQGLFYTNPSRQPITKDFTADIPVIRDRRRFFAIRRHFPQILAAP